MSWSWKCLSWGGGKTSLQHVPTNVVQHVPTNVVTACTDKRRYSMYRQTSLQHVPTNVVTACTDKRRYSMYRQTSLQHVPTNAVTACTDKRRYSMYRQTSLQHVPTNVVTACTDKRRYSMYRRHIVKVWVPRNSNRRIPRSKMLFKSGIIYSLDYIFVIKNNMLIVKHGCVGSY